MFNVDSRSLLLGDPPLVTAPHPAVQHAFPSRYDSSGKHTDAQQFSQSSGWASTRLAVLIMHKLLSLVTRSKSGWRVVLSAPMRNSPGSAALEFQLPTRIWPTPARQQSALVKIVSASRMVPVHTQSPVINWTVARNRVLKMLDTITFQVIYNFLFFFHKKCTNFEILET